MARAPGRAAASKGHSRFRAAAWLTADSKRAILLLALCVFFAHAGRDRFFAPFVLFRPIFMTHAGIQAAVRGEVNSTEARLMTTRQEEFEQVLRKAGVVPQDKATAPAPAIRAENWTRVLTHGVLPEPFARRLLFEATSVPVAENGAAITLADDRIVFIGQVARSIDGAGIVISTSDPASQVPVEVDRFGSGLLLRGAFPERYLELMYAPRESGIRMGDEVRLSGPSRASGALIGWVATVREMSDGPFLEVKVHPATRIEDLRHVWIENSSGI